MDEKTARKYQRAKALPSDLKPRHTWRTRVDPFAAVWPELRELLAVNPGLQATTLLAELQRRCPGQFADGQLRTLQRHLKQWRALEGPAREVFFPQQHFPGEIGASDFCHLSGLGITIQGRPFVHLFYHFVLTYSNWETGSICFSESFESLSAGLQDALWELGGVPQRHRTDSLSAAVYNLNQVKESASHRPALKGASVAPAERREEFRRSYQALLQHYGLQGEHTQVGRGNENGDIEQRHHRFKVALDQALMLRGSRDFNSRAEYVAFLRGLLDQLNAGRAARFQQERHMLAPLPAARLDTCKQLRVRVGPGSTMRVLHNVYSVHSRLIGEWVEVRVGADELEVWCGQRLVERLPRLRGEGRHRIAYRHIIDWLVRKPGAFANYRYRADLFPSSHFRLAYDQLQVTDARRADKEYLAILQLAARENEQRVEEALRWLLATEAPLSSAAVTALVHSAQRPGPVTEVVVAPVNLSAYDGLLELPESLALHQSVSHAAWHESAPAHRTKGVA
jgi:hypothetical protein